MSFTALAKQVSPFDGKSMRNSTESVSGSTFHNEQITLMRTTPDECRQIARWICHKLNRSTAPLLILIPEKGVSMIDAPGESFYDPAADAALFEEFEAVLDQTPTRQIRRLPYNINDDEFAAALVAAYEEVAAMG